MNFSLAQNKNNFVVYNHPLESEYRLTTQGTHIDKLILGLCTQIANKISNISKIKCELFNNIDGNIIQSLASTVDMENISKLLNEVVDIINISISTLSIDRKNSTSYNSFGIDDSLIIHNTTKQVDDFVKLLEEYSKEIDVLQQDMQFIRAIVLLIRSADNMVLSDNINNLQYVLSQAQNQYPALLSNSYVLELEAEIADLGKALIEADPLNNKSVYNKYRKFLNKYQSFRSCNQDASGYDGIVAKLLNSQDDNCPSNINIAPLTLSTLQTRLTNTIFNIKILASHINRLNIEIAETAALHTKM